MCVRSSSPGVWKPGGGSAGCRARGSDELARQWSAVSAHHSQVHCKEFTASGQTQRGIPERHTLIACYSAEGGHKHREECPNHDQNYCFCKGPRWGCVWLKHQHRNLQFVASLLHRKDHVRVPGKTFGQLFSMILLTSWTTWQNKLCLYYGLKRPNYLRM